MRGRRFLLIPTLALLAFVPPVQAIDPPALDPDGDVTAIDPCFSLRAALENPLTALDIAKQCTVTITQTEHGLMVTVDAEPIRIAISSVVENGAVILEIVISYAEQEHDLVVKCSKPGGFIPTWPVRTQDADCWPPVDPKWD